MTVFTNSGLKIYMESAIAAPVTITGVTKANPGVLSATAHGYSDGDIILIECSGMQQINGRLFVVYSKTTDSFSLEDVDGTSGIDTTNYDDFVSGTAKKITLGTSLSGVSNFSSSGGEPKFADTTTIHDKQDKQQVNGMTAVSYGMDIQWDPQNAAQAAMSEAFRIGGSKGFKVLWSNGTFMLFHGSVGFSNIPGGSSQAVTTSKASIALGGLPTYGC